MDPKDKTHLLEVKGLNVSFFTDRDTIHAVRDVSFVIKEAETLGLVGESGSGKSVTALSIMRLIEEPGRIAGGSILFNGVDLLRLDNEEMRKRRGREIAMVFQEPLTALNPVITVGEQTIEQIMAHTTMNKGAAKKKAMELFSAVHLNDPERVYYSYPHTMSGGMRQRAMIAMAISLNPKLLIADEPTTALDVTIQAGILELLDEIRQKFKMSILFITHDFGIVAQVADRVAVMRKGNIVEQGSAEDIFYRPKAAYTRELLAAVPRIPVAKND